MQHKLYLLISKDLTEIAKISFNTKEDEKILVSSKQYFVVAIMYPIFEILNKLEDLNYSIYLIKYYPIYKKLRKKITRKNYITYHLEYYLISQIALFDRVLHFCNIIYELGLDDRYVTYDIIRSNSKMNNDCKVILKKFYDYLEKSKIRQLQNKVKHKEKLRDKKIEKASFFEMASIISNTTKDLEVKKDLEEATTMSYKIYLAIKEKEMIKEVEILEKFVSDIFDVVYPIIEKKYKNY